MDMDETTIGPERFPGQSKTTDLVNTNYVSQGSHNCPDCGKEIPLLLERCNACLVARWKMDDEMQRKSV